MIIENAAIPLSPAIFISAVLNKNIDNAFDIEETPSDEPLYIIGNISTLANFPLYMLIEDFLLKKGIIFIKNAAEYEIPVANAAPPIPILNFLINK
ncbi:hypothetical protein SDC9_123893 [bioreactor metagenome]|uniref:Uncharacterized protein n=1 Tax=bioreactor metagenome TaxID=1076179 RepID=A0A645CIY1_9ZZZZ